MNHKHILHGLKRCISFTSIGLPQDSLAGYLSQLFDVTQMRKQHGWAIFKGKRIDVLFAFQRLHDGTVATLVSFIRWFQGIQKGLEVFKRFF